MQLTSLHAASLQSSGHGARQIGLGEAVTAGAAQGAYGIYYNPAQLALAANPEISMDYAKLLLGLTDNSNLEESYLGFIYPWKRVRGPNQALGLARSLFSLESRTQDRLVNLFSEEVFYLSYGRSFTTRMLGGQMQVGTTVKQIRRTFGDVRTNNNALDNTGKATNRADPVLSGGREKKAMSLDLGWNWRHASGWSLGLSMGDINEPNLALDPKIADKLRRSYRVGTAYQAGPYLVFVGNLELKNRIESVQDQRIALGAERLIPTAQFGSFGFRGSLGIGNRSWRTVAAGVSWKSNALSVDYGFQMPLGGLESIQGNHRISLTIRFGEAPPEEEIMDLYRKERKARERLEREIETVVGDFEKLLAASEARARDIPAAPVAQVPQAPKEIPMIQAPAAPERPKVSDSEFALAWKLYQERKKSLAPRAELVRILRHMLDTFGDRREVKREWESMQQEIARDRKDFEQIWANYKRLASMNASKEILYRALQRIVKRFEGSGVDLAEVQREMDRVRSK